MPRSNNRRRPRRRTRNNRGGRTVGYAAPLYRELNAPQHQSITLHGNFQVASNVLGTNGGLMNVQWTFFNDAAALALVYKYFEIQSCRLRFSLATTTAAIDSFNGCALAFFPINYITEGIILTVPTQRNQVQDLPGSIFVQQGVNNTGKWFSPGIKQQFACSDAFSTSLGRLAGAVVWFADDIGISEILGDVDLEITLRFSQREYASNASLASLFNYIGKNRAQVGEISVEEIHEEPSPRIDPFKLKDLSQASSHLLRANSKIVKK